MNIWCLYVWENVCVCIYYRWCVYTNVCEHVVRSVARAWRTIWDTKEHTELKEVEKKTKDLRVTTATTSNGSERENVCFFSCVVCLLVVWKTGFKLNYSIFRSKENLLVYAEKNCPARMNEWEKCSGMICWNWVTAWSNWCEKCLRVRVHFFGCGKCKRRSLYFSIIAE